MKNCNALVAATVVPAALAAFCSFAAGQTAAQRPPLPFPPGYDFPANPTVLQAMITKRDTAGLRRHGWYLWAGLNQPGYDGWPIWRSWNIATQAFAPPQSGAAGATRTPAGSHAGASLTALNMKNNPAINLLLPIYLIPDKVREKHPDVLAPVFDATKLPDGDNFQNNGDLMLVSEPYSPEAYDYIRGKNIGGKPLFEATTLNALMGARKTDIPQAPRRSIVLKHMYWPVKKDGLSALPVVDMSKYHQSAVPDTAYVGFENMERWPQAVAIDPSRPTIPPGEKADVTYLYDVRKPNDGSTPLEPLGPHTYRGATVVSIADFYHKQLSQADYNALSENDRVLIDASFYWAHGRVFEPGDYLVAMASHVITKEIPQWTLQSVWWHDKPNETEYARDRPDIPAAKGPWRHYLLVSEYGVTANPGGKELPNSYNPYIELASHPVKTNCRNCHIRAAWPSGVYIQSPGPAALDNIQLNDPIFRNLLRTDFLWTISDRAIRPQ